MHSFFIVPHRAMPKKSTECGWTRIKQERERETKTIPKDTVKRENWRWKHKTTAKKRETNKKSQRECQEELKKVRTRGRTRRKRRAKCIVVCWFVLERSTWEFCDSIFVEQLFLSVVKTSRVNFGLSHSLSLCFNLSASYTVTL